ncbi:adenylate/guanylate cyclase domain-containing protein [Acuticoccus sediminis]|uniref:adenylate/guanylate cyclase domain-containing protein n=1 Tax=Acuticoccus sediminis TaxID=2184697 RepID=UPI001CFEDFBD|nr:adenylate/guanylate cyclase domain-containing protein [Acuticoccus sediminis]
MDLPPTVAWLVDEASAVSGPDRFLADLAARLTGDGVPLARGAVAIAVPHPIISHRTFLWRGDTGAVVEAFGFSAGPGFQAARDWLAGSGPVHEAVLGRAPGTTLLGWAAARPLDPGETRRVDEASRFAAAPLAALAARAALTGLLEAYLGRRSAARVEAGAHGRGTGETIRAALLYADLRDFTVMSEATEPAVMIAALDAWFDRVAGAVHAFGGEVLKFIGDGVLAIFPVVGSPGEACEAALRAAAAARAGMAHLDAARRAQGAPPLRYGMALHLGEVLWGNVGAANRLDFTAIGPAVNLVSRLEGLCRVLGRPVLVSGAVAAEIAAPLVPLGEHPLRGVATPCAVFALPDG